MVRFIRPAPNFKQNTSLIIINSLSILIDGMGETRIATASFVKYSMPILGFVHHECTNVLARGARRRSFRNATRGRTRARQAGCPSGSRCLPSGNGRFRMTAAPGRRRIFRLRACVPACLLACMHACRGRRTPFETGKRAEGRDAALGTRRPISFNHDGHVRQRGRSAAAFGT